MIEIAVISDTHVPSRAREIPDWVCEAVRAADHTIHAGDFDSPPAYERVVELADGDLTAARGNVDPGSLGIPAVDTVEFEGRRFVVTHGTGDREGYFDRVLDSVRSEDGDVGISGHSHEVHDETRGGVRLLNPGTATGASPAEEATMMLVTVEDSEIDVDLRRE